MPKAMWNGEVIAESDRFEVVDGNYYFPPETVKREFLRDSSQNTVCGWKGTASYYDVAVNGRVNKAAAWFYPEVKPAAQNIKGMIAFWHGVTVSR